MTFFVSEACEYCDNFLYLHPYLSVITNIEPEHLDYFKTFEYEKKSFEKFKEKSEIVIDESFVKKMQYRAKYIRINKFGKIAFSLYVKNQKVYRFYLNIGGKFNVDNAIYAVLACQRLGIDLKNIKLALESFEGVKKRCERVENAFEFQTFVDYAHHPGEIKKSAEYFKKICKNRCICVFQPHTYSRTKKFFYDFIKSLSIFDEIICFKTYPAREEKNEGLSEYDLYLGLLEKNKKAYHVTTKNGLRSRLRRYKNGDMVVFLGAGDLPDYFDFFKPLA